MGLVELLNSDGDGANRLLDVQWKTDHLETLGAVELPREEYLHRLSNIIYTGSLSAFRANIRNRP